MKTGLLLALAAAASQAAGLYGTLRDSAGLPVPAAPVRLRSAPTQTQATAWTGPEGEYRFVSLRPGVYVLTVARPGFQTLQRSGLAIGAGQNLRLDLRLELGDASAVVEVSGAPPLLDSARGTASYAVEETKLVNIPLDGRNFVPLVALAPGVSLPPGSTLPRINGGRPRVSEYLYDGISVLQPEPGQVAYFPIVDAIEEFRVETNSFSAEYGRANGGIILVNQKSGGNQFHGTLFEFFRNEALNARNLFATRGGKPLFRRNQYGFVLGGPIRRRRTFFFTDWQGTRLRTGVVRASTVPGLRERQGMFDRAILDPTTRRPFAANTIPRARWDRAAAGQITRYPQPDGELATANNYTRTGTETVAQDQFDVRIDEYAGPHRLFARYTMQNDETNPVTPFPDGSGRIASGVLSGTLTRGRSLAVEDNWTLSAALANQFRFGYTSRGLTRAPLRPGAAYDVAGYQLLGPAPNSTSRFSTSVMQWIDNVSWYRGRHSVRAGADVRRQALDVLQPASPDGLFQFDSILTGHSFASFLLGQVQSFQMDVQEEKLRPRANLAEFYLQDDVQAGRRLTINAGLRYTLNFPSTVKGDRGAVFDLQRQRLNFLGRDGFPRSARNLEWGNFGPRLGLAVKVRERLALRAGYGLTWIEQAGITTPFTTPLFPFVRTIQQISPDNLRPVFELARGPSLTIEPPGPDTGLGYGVFAVQRDQKSGYAQQWNLTLQKTFGEHWSISAGYLGSKLTSLGVPDVNLNQLRAEQLAPGPALADSVANPDFGIIPSHSPLGRPLTSRQQLLRPYPRYSVVSLYRNNTGHSTYHSMQLKFDKRFTAGITLTAAYTFSKLIDDAGAVFDAALLTGPAAAFQAADSHNRRLEKAASTGHMPHVLSAAFVWEPAWMKGWRMAGLSRAQSGSPVAVTQQPNHNAFAGFGIQRPNLLREPGPIQRSTAQWFDTAAFAAAPQFTLGSAPRNPVNGPPYRTLDLMVAKSFPAGERASLEIRAEVFNLTNTPPLGSPGGSFGTPQFGVVSSALDPRVFELVLKVHF